MFNLNKILKNDFVEKIFHSFFGRISYIAFLMLFSFLCTRLYGVEQFGEFSYYYSIVSILMVVATLGMNNGLIYYIPRENYKYVSVSILFNFLASMLIVVSLGLLFDNKILWLMLPLIWLLSVEQLFFGIHQAIGDLKGFYKIYGFWSMIIRVVLLILFYLLFGDKVFFIILSVYTSVVFSLIFYFYKFKNAFTRINFDIKFIKYSIPLMFATALAGVINKIDILMLGLMTDDKTVGIYQITFQIANIIAVLLLVFNGVFAPKISHYFHNNKMEDLKKLYIKSTQILAGIAAIYFIIIVLLGYYILYIFGDDLTVGYSSLIIRSFGQFINVAVGSVWFMMSMTGEPKFQMYAHIIALLVNFSLNYLLIPIFGMDGAAFASMVSLITINVTGYIIVKKKFKLKVFRVF